MEYSDENSLLLDELVHDVAAQQAANVNNKGIAAQLDYLLVNGYTLKDIEEWLEDCKD